MNTQGYWDQKHDKYAEQDWIVKPTIFATQVINFFPKGAKILELGCGQGQDTKYFTDNGFSVVACDFSNHALDLARSRVNAEFKQIDLGQTLDFPAESFDVVYSHLALHYFDQKRTEDLFNEIYNILKPGGIFATFNNTMDDPEIPNSTKIEEGLYMTPVGIQKRFFTIDSFFKLVSRFETILLDNKGETHKDPIKTLIRFVGKKK